jgi:nicotinamidase-related amidase
MIVQPDDALIVVDVQNDFCPGGALAVEEGADVVPIINQLEPRFHTVVFTRDWHPANHCSFSATPEFKDMSWPPHCVQDSQGAAHHPNLLIPKSAIIVSKGDLADREAYSGFGGTDLHHILREQSISRVFICGLATDYCVKHTALDALGNQYNVVLIEDAVRGVDPCTTGEALHELKKAGVSFCRSGDIE